MRILYAGDSSLGGAANYLLGILKFLKADLTHIPPSKILTPRILTRNFDAVVLSDFSEKNTPLASQRIIASQVKEGTGLIMIGGWGSFSGPLGGWQGSQVEKILPVTCLRRDDRINFPGGALVIPKRKHGAFQSVNFQSPPVICGLNRIQPKEKSLTLLVAKKVIAREGPNHSFRLNLDPAEYPLLVINPDPLKRIAAFASDLAPHWCGGLVDWGNRGVKIKIRGKIEIEVGNGYIRFVSSLLKWLTQKRRCS